MLAVRDGWLLASFSGDELAPVELGVGGTEPEQWRPAFLDWADGERVAMVRAPTPGGHVQVWLRTPTSTALVGRITLPEVGS